jgi:hypothetical protein
VVADATLLTSTLVRLRLQASRPPAAVPRYSNGRQFAAVVRSSVDAATSKDDLPETFVSGLSNGGNAPNVGRRGKLCLRPEADLATETVVAS